MMNRSFRGRESLMPSIRPTNAPQLRSLRSGNNAMREKEDELALFREMRKRDKEKSDLLLLNDKDEFDDSLVSQSGNSPLFDIPADTPAPLRKTGAEEFLSSDGDKNDYDWLLTPPGTPLFPSLEMEARKNYMDEAEAPRAQPTALRSRLANSQMETTVRSNLVPRQSIASAGLNSLASGLRRPSSSGGPGSRPSSSGGPGSRPVTPGGSRSATPTGRPTITSSKPSRPSTPTSRAALPSGKSALHTSPKPTGSLASTRSTVSMASTRSAGPSRSSTPTRSTVRPTGPSRSSTPTRSTARSSTPTRPTARSSTPTARSTIPTSRPTSRASTPTRRPSTPSRLPSGPAYLNKSSSSLSSKSGSAPARNPVSSRGTSPTVRSRPWNPSEMPGFSLDAPPNLRTTLPDRPLSATRGRPAAPSARSASVEPASNGRPRRQSCSPSRGRAPNGHASGSSVPAVNRGHSKVNDDISPVVMGTKMVERVVHMRKLAPPRQVDKHSPSLSGKSASSPDSSGFGRTLSKKSLDMAIRHMDIRRTVPGNLRPLMMRIPASSMYSVRTASVSDSPIATSSNASSELSVNNHVIMDGHASEVEDDLASERSDHASPTSVQGR